MKRDGAEEEVKMAAVECGWRREVASVSPKPLKSLSY